MIGASHTIVTDRPQLSFLDRVAVWLATGFCVWVLFEVGWLVLRPNDPQAPVSLLSRGAGGWSVLAGAVSATVFAAALNTICAVIATVIGGRRLADVGAFAAMIGLTALSLRGDTAEYFVLEGAALSPRAVALLFVAEAILWLLIGLLAVAAAGLVTKWCFGGVYGADGRRSGPLPMIPAAVDAPRVGERFGPGSIPRTPADVGAKHTAIVLAAGLFAFMLLSIGAGQRVIQHGQAIFTAAATVCIACYIAYHAAPVRSALWSILGAALLVIVAYLWAAIRPPAGDLPPSVPPSPFLRVLPIQFVSAAIASAIAMSWYMYMPPEPEPTPPPRAARPQKR
jgi:hypothetical protein